MEYPLPENRMIKEILGVHVWEKYGPVEWEEELLAITLLSILKWKKHHGRIALYTNEEYLDLIKPYGIDQLYDYVDTETLTKVSPYVNKNRYWAFGKIHVASTITEPFVILDNDLWINRPLELDDNMSYVGYHYENFDSKKEDTPYVDFFNLIPPSMIGRWNREVLPTNTALLWINNPDLLKEWVECATEIASHPMQIEIDDPKNLRRTVLIEQRLLPMIAAEKNLPYSTFIPQVYQTQNLSIGNGWEWEPHPSYWTEEQTNAFDSIRHIWGGKTLWSVNDRIKRLMFDVALMDFNEVQDEAKPFEVLISKLK